MTEDELVNSIAETKANKVGTNNGSIVVRKKSNWEKFKSNMFEGDIKQIGEYVFKERIFPSFKELCLNILVESLNMIFYGSPSGTGRPTVGPNAGNSRTQYNVISNRQASKPASNSPSLDPDEFLVCSNRATAESIRADMLEAIANVGRLSVLETYDIANNYLGEGEKLPVPPYSYDNYGWTNLNGSYIKGIRGGYIIVVPKPVVIR